MVVKYFSPFILFLAACNPEMQSGSAVSETEIVSPAPNEDLIEVTRSASQNILTSTDLRYQNMCRAIEGGAASSLRSGIRSLQRHPDQRFYNIGVDQITDLFGDGVFDASAALVSDTSPKFHGRNIQIFSPNRAAMSNPREGISFLNEQPFTKEIRKVSQGDLNGDGVVDLVFFDYGEHDGTLHDGKVVLLLSEGDNYRWEELRIDGNLRIHTGTLMDIDNDRDLDILFGSVGSQERIFAYQNNGSGGFTKIRKPGPDSQLGDAWVSLNSSDIDQDGYHDLIAESHNPQSDNFGVQVVWGSSEGLFGGLFGGMNISQLQSAAVDDGDLLMDSIVVQTDSGAEIYATFAADSYQAGSKIVRFNFSGRQQISSSLILNREFREIKWINTVYPCETGLKFFSYNRAGFDLSSHFR
jgi:hypothetical protein